MWPCDLNWTGFESPAYRLFQVSVKVVEPTETVLNVEEHSRYHVLIVATKLLRILNALSKVHCHPTHSLLTYRIGYICVRGETAQLVVAIRAPSAMDAQRAGLTSGAQGKVQTGITVDLRG